MARSVTPPPDGGYPNNNTAEGDNALLSLTTGANNTAVGAGALLNNTLAGGNTAYGSNTLSSNTIGSNNTATGFQALLSNTNANNNTASGYQALSFDTTGGANTATGAEALLSNSTGSSNTSVGFDALGNNTTGSSNIALGVSAGVNLTTGSSNIDIGNAGVAGESKVIRLGTKLSQKNTFIAGISGVTVAGGVTVIIDTNGHLGTVVSSERFKDAIKPMDKASEAILALQPVTFRYKHDLDPDDIPQFGLVAEQVEKVNPALVARDEEGRAYTVRYEAVNAMLLNEFLKEHRKVEEEAQINQQQEATIIQVKSTVAKQETIIAEQQRNIETLIASVKRQASQIQKVSDQLELNKPAPRTVVSER